ncbi:MAG: hypothetical protein ACFFCS_20635 [Candidatus Hodarchaeota archaeon]
MQFKEDFEEAKERMSAWWDGETIDRPFIAYTYQRPDVPTGIGGPDNWILARKNDAIKEAVDYVEKFLPTQFYGGEAFPNYHPNYGPGVLACVLGVEPKYTHRTRTTWFLQPMPVEEVMPFLEEVKLDNNNEWYVRLKKITEYAAKRAKGKYQVAVTDLGGALDVLASILDPKDLYLAMRKNPEVVDAARAIIMEIWLQVYDDLQTIIESYGHGCNGWMNVWCPKRWYPLQCDVSYGISPKMFRRFVLPDLVAQAESMDYAIYHLDGVGQLPFLDDLLAEPSITGIQWVPGAGKAPMCSEEWMPVYEKIQAAGKNIVQSASPDLALNMYEKFDPKGMLIRVGYGAKIWADFSLPTWMGGMGGIDDEDDD